MFKNFFFSKMVPLLDNVEKCGKDRGATSDVTIWRIRILCLISKATCTHAHAHAHVPEYKHESARAHTQIQTHTHTQAYTTYCLSMAK
jgi:hypothetical protein